MDWQTGDMSIFKIDPKKGKLQNVAPEMSNISEILLVIHANRRRHFPTFPSGNLSQIGPNFPHLQGKFGIGKF